MQITEEYLSTLSDTDPHEAHRLRVEWYRERSLAERERHKKAMLERALSEKRFAAILRAEREAEKAKRAERQALGREYRAAVRAVRESARTERQAKRAEKIRAQEAAQAQRTERQAKRAEKIRAQEAAQAQRTERQAKRAEKIRAQEAKRAERAEKIRAQEAQRTERQAKRAEKLRASAHLLASEQLPHWPQARSFYHMRLQAGREVAECWCYAESVLGTYNMYGPCPA